MAIPRGRIGSSRKIAAIRSITREDLPRLLGPRDRAASMPQKLRDSHHTIARMLATGMKRKRICELTGYTYNRISTLAASPAMAELVAHYRAQIDAAFIESQDAFFNIATQNMLAAERHIADRIAELDEEGELLPVRDAIAISRDAADRFGYGKKQTNVNVNTDFAQLLERAITRSAKVIDGNVVPIRQLAGSEAVPMDGNPSFSPSTTSVATPSSVPAQPSIKRRA